VRAEPDTASEKLGSLSEGDQRRVDELVFGDYSWLRTPWQGTSGTAWIAGEFTDFPRSRAYSQAAGAWYESAAVLELRRGLMRDLLRARGAEADKIAQVDQMAGDPLRKLEDTLTRQAVPAGYVNFWQMQERLGLPAPFDVLPVHSSPPAGIKTVEFSGFGPNTFAYENWSIYYEDTRGLHSGVDYIVPEGSPLIAVADGVIVDFRFLSSAQDQSLALRSYLPDQYRKPDGSRVLSNVIVAYGHLTGDPTAQLVHVGSVVQAGQIIGTSGWPVYTSDDGTVSVQHNNAHLHLEIHLVTDGQHKFGSRQPFNPLLFWSPRLIAFQARLAPPHPYPTEGQPWGRLGLFSLGCFRYEPPTIVWDYQPESGAIWPEGVYDLNSIIKLLGTFAPYPVHGSSAF
jgi:murein DD-endopeptidase MepM/ murein hydrolase activator NlpD